MSLCDRRGSNYARHHGFAVLKVFDKTLDIIVTAKNTENWYDYYGRDYDDYVRSSSTSHDSHPLVLGLGWLGRPKTEPYIQLV